MIPQDRSGIIETFKRGELLKSLFTRSRDTNNATAESIAKLCAEVHNSKEIDLISLITEEQLTDISNQDFFTGQRLLCKAIPYLDCTPKEMMGLVESLIKKGGNDGAANRPNEPFIQWCKSNPLRSIEIVQSAKSGDLQSVKFLEVALLGNDMDDEAMSFVAENDGEQRLAAVAALGKMSLGTLEKVRKVFNLFTEALKNQPNDRLRAVTLFSTLNIAASNDQTECDEVIGIVEEISNEPGELTNIYCAISLSTHYKKLNKATIVALLKVLSSVNPAHKGTIDQIDLALGMLLPTPHADEAIELAKNLLMSHVGLLKITDFDYFSSQLMTGDSKRFQKVFVSWMMTGSRALAENLSRMMRAREHSKTPLEIAFDDFNLTPKEMIFLCRKMIGYFFIQPVIASSVIVSMMRESDKAIRSVLSDHLYDPLLINYGGDVQTYLRSLKPKDAAYSCVKKVLQRGDLYLADLRSTRSIKELSPSADERQAERIRYTDEMQTAQKEAEKSSVFLQFVKRSVILHGRRSLTYVSDRNQSRRPIETTLQEHSSSIEIPRIDIYDPVGLDFMLQMFRIEQLAP